MSLGLTLEFAAAEGTTPRARSAPLVQTRTASLRVRPLSEDDLDQVAGLFVERFRPRQRSPKTRREIAQRMKALYLDAPTRASDPDALVAIGPSGEIGAFLGAMRAPFVFDGQPATACITSTLMASPAPSHGLAALQVLRENRRRDYDLIVTDTANRASLAMNQAVNYQVVSPDSLEWAVVFEPASLALHKVRQRLGVGLLGALKPVARTLDLAAAGAIKFAAGAPKRRQGRDEEVEPEAFIEIAERLSEPFRLRPAFARSEFLWLIERAKRRTGAGPLRLRVIYDGADAPVAAYAAFAEKGGIARVFHQIAAPHAWGRLFDHARENAQAWGCIGAHGPLKAPMMAHAYSVRGAFFYYASGVMFYSKRPDIRQAIESGQALLGGFAGDRWSDLASEKFD